MTLTQSPAIETNLFPKRTIVCSLDPCIPESSLYELQAIHESKVQVDVFSRNNVFSPRNLQLFLPWPAYSFEGHLFFQGTTNSTLILQLFIGSSPEHCLDLNRDPNLYLDIELELDLYIGTALDLDLNLKLTLTLKEPET